MVVALAPELDIASQGLTPAEALANLKEAVSEIFIRGLPYALSASLSCPWESSSEADGNENGGLIGTAKYP